MIIYESDSLWITLIEKSFKTQSIFFGIEILILHSKKKIKIKISVFR